MHHESTAGALALPRFDVDDGGRKQPTTQGDVGDCISVAFELIGRLGGISNIAQHERYVDEIPGLLVAPGVVVNLVDHFIQRLHPCKHRNERRAMVLMVLFRLRFRRTLRLLLLLQPEELEFGTGTPGGRGEAAHAAAKHAQDRRTSSRIPRLDRPETLPQRRSWLVWKKT